MRSSFILIVLFLSCSPSYCQTRLEAQGGDTPCTWSDRFGHKGKTICRIIEQGTIHGQTSSVISVTNRSLAYHLDYDNYRAELVSVLPNAYKTLWKGKFTNKYDKKDPLLETISVSDGVTFTIRRF
jgi:hypothetical protein